MEWALGLIHLTVRKVLKAILLIHSAPSTTAQKRKSISIWTILMSSVDPIIGAFSVVVANMASALYWAAPSARSAAIDTELRPWYWDLFLPWDGCLQQAVVAICVPFLHLADRRIFDLHPQAIPEGDTASGIQPSGCPGHPLSTVIHKASTYHHHYSFTH